MAAYYKVEVSLGTNAVEVGIPSPQSVNVVLPLIGPQGAVGAVGPTGPTGSTGPANSLAIGTVTTGAEGSAAAAAITGTAPSQTLSLTIPVGATGATGSANSLDIGTVSTGAPGSSAAATVTGTAPAQTLNLTIPRGDVGATGATGAVGPQGPAGTATTSASDLTSGTLADARLSANVALEDVANTFTQNQTLNGTNNVAPNQTAASGSSLMTRDLTNARTYWRGVAFYGASQTAADQANFFPTAGENYFPIIAVPSKIELHIEVEFTTAPLAANPANFEFRLGLRDVEAANLNTKINITRVAASSVTKISGIERYIIKGTIDTFPATWATRISTYGAAVVADVGELFNLTGGSLTLTVQNGRVLYRVYL
jgi:hypothetical protein